MQEPCHRDYIMTVQSFGTGGNLTMARMVVIWMRWLDLIGKKNPHYARIFSRLIHFAFANTHRDSLEDARLTVREQRNLFPHIKVKTSFELMDQHVPEERQGKGARNLQEGKDAIEAFMPQVQALIANSHFYLPLATLGLGNTGSSAIVPVTEAALQDPGCWVIPQVILSSASELNQAKLEFQEAQRKKLLNLPVWVVLADNAYFNQTKDLWNRRLSMQESYNRIDYLLISALRSFLLMFTHNVQIDQSKLEGLVFSGKGGTLCIGAIDINVHGDIPKEIDRAAHLLFDSPFLMEYYPDENQQDRMEKAKFDVLVLGTMGGISAPQEHQIIEGLKAHSYVKEFLPNADMLVQRFGSYLPAEATSMFALLTRKRPGGSVDLIYPPANHPDIVALRKLEVAAETDLTVEKMGRDEVLELEFPIRQPSSSIVPLRPTQTFLNLIEDDPSNVTDFLLDRDDLMAKPNSCGELITLLNFIVEHSLEQKISSTKKSWLLDQLMVYPDTCWIPSQGHICGMDFSDRDSLLKIESVYSRAQDKTALTEEERTAFEHLNKLRLYLKVFGNQITSEKLARFTVSKKDLARIA